MPSAAGIQQHYRNNTGMHGCVELHFHITIFTRVLYDDDTAAHQAQAHSLDKCLLIEKAFTDSSRTEDILFCLATVVPAIQKRKLNFPIISLLLHGKNFALYCLPHLCWSMPWGHLCCFSAGDKQKASFHLVRT